MAKGWMYSCVREQSLREKCPRTLSDQTMVTQRLAALRSHGSRFGDLGKRLNPGLGASFREHLPSTDLSQRKA